MDKRELIKKIKGDLTLTEKEKTQKIQQIMMGNFIQNQVISNESKTCNHYIKLCYKFYFDCCKIYDPCKRCHSERNCQKKDNLSVDKISCSICEKTQEPGENCIECGVKFSNSYCNICQIWTEKDITHCDKCGLCRLGKANDLFHCDDCGICFNKFIDNEEQKINNITHECIVKKNKFQNVKSGYREGVCVVCSENTFNSQSKSFPIDCGHFIHQECWNEYIKHGQYKCPYCKKSIGDLSLHWNYIRNLIQTHPLPDDYFPIQINDIVDTQFGKFEIKSINIISDEKIYTGKFVNWKSSYAILNSKSVKKNIYKKIHCNDCGEKSTTIYHPYGLECLNCKSYNTQE